MSYSTARIDKIMADLDEMIEASQATLDNANDKDNPNEDRIEELELRIDQLEIARDALQEIENTRV